MDVTKLVGIEVASKGDAKRVHEAIENREEEGKLEFEEVTLVYKTDGGHVRTKYYGATGFGIGASIGAGLGLGGALGLLTVGVAPALIGIGLIPGLFAGGFVGHFFTKHFAGKEFLRDIGDGLDAGKGYVFVATDDAGAEFLQSDSSTDGHRLAEIDITPEFVEDLQKAHAEAVQSAGEAPDEPVEEE